MNEKPKKNKQSFAFNVASLSLRRELERQETFFKETLATLPSPKTEILQEIEKRKVDGRRMAEKAVMRILIEEGSKDPLNFTNSFRFLLP
ncbi:MAG: hypothetical protein K9G62_04425 [Alphaproteobacteria bacterium]|nr:hypothetical protein [Alphaproteobacteria bacterium]